MQALRAPFIAPGTRSALMANVLHAQSPPTTDAGATLEEIIVAAERRALDAQKLSTSVAVRSDRELLEHGKFSLRKIVEEKIPDGSAADVANTNQGSKDSLNGAYAEWNSDLAKTMTLSG